MSRVVFSRVLLAASVVLVDINVCMTYIIHFPNGAVIVYGVVGGGLWVWVGANIGEAKHSNRSAMEIYNCLGQLRQL